MSAGSIKACKLIFIDTADHVNEEPAVVTPPIREGLEKMGFACFRIQAKPQWRERITCLINRWFSSLRGKCVNFCQAQKLNRNLRLGWHILTLPFSRI